MSGGFLKISMDSSGAINVGCLVEKINSAYVVFVVVRYKHGLDFSPFEVFKNLSCRIRTTGIEKEAAVVVKVNPVQNSPRTSVPTLTASTSPCISEMSMVID